jgi:hypothetical protein
MSEARITYHDACDYANFALEKLSARLHEEIMRYVEYRTLPEDFPQLAQAYALCEKLNLEILREMAAEEETEVLKDE